MGVASAVGAGEIAPKTPGLVAAPGVFFLHFYFLQLSCICATPYDGAVGCAEWLLQRTVNPSPEGIGGSNPPPTIELGSVPVSRGCVMRISELRADIEKWEAAAAAVARSKSYVVDGLTYTRQDLAAIEKTLEGLYSRLACVLRRGSCHRVSPVRPIDYIHTRGVIY